MIRLFRVAVPTSVVVLLLSELILLSFCYILATYLFLQVDPRVFLLDDGGLARILAAVLSIVLGLHFLDLYSDIRTVSKISLVLEIGQTIGVAFLVQALLAYVNKEWMMPRWVMIWGSALSLIALSGWRMIYGFASQQGFGAQRVLFLGQNAVVREIAEYLEQHPEAGYINLGYLEDGNGSLEPVCGAKVLGGIEELTQIVGHTHPDRIVVGMTERRSRMPLPQLLDLRFSGIRIEDAAQTYENTCGRVCTKELRPAQLIFSGELGPTHSAVFLQSIYSPLIALAGCVLTLPLMILAFVAVKLTSRGPALYRQVRVGMNGTTFTLYKFRSMYVDAEAKTGAVWASKDDPRVTPLGRWLRKLRVDELPQMWNVLRGEMSVVGPRPERPEFVKILGEKIPYYRQRHCVKPGITGWAQINHKYGDTLEDSVVKLEYDLYYIKHISLSLDAYVIFHTVKTMLRSRGAQ